MKIPTIFMMMIPTDKSMCKLVHNSWSHGRVSTSRDLLRQMVYMNMRAVVMLRVGGCWGLGGGRHSHVSPGVTRDPENVFLSLNSYM